MHRTKIALFGIFGVDNFGNECTLQAVLQNLQEYTPGSELYCVCYGPDDTKKRYGIPAVPILSKRSMGRQGLPQEALGGAFSRFMRMLLLRSPIEILDWFRAYRTLRGTNLLVMTGTGMLTDFSTSAFGFPFDIFKWTTAAKLAGTKVAFIGIGVGPIYEWLSKVFIRRGLAIASYRSFRDELSSNRLKKLGCDVGRDPILPDLAFSLSPEMFAGPNGNGMRTPTVGLGVMHFEDPHLPVRNPAAYDEYIAKMSDLVLWLAKKGYGVRILEGDARYDREVKRRLREKIESQGRTYEELGVIDQNSETVEELVSQLAETDFVISPRYHNLILALMLGKLVMSISYDPKNDVLLQGLGLGKYCQDITNINLEQLKEQFEDLAARGASLRPEIMAHVECYRRRLLKQYEAIREQYLRNGV